MRVSKYKLRFEVNQLPPTQNAQLRGGWRTKHGNAKKWKKLVWDATIDKQKPRDPIKKARLVLTRFSSVRGDYDGRVASFKPVVDGIVECKILAGDTEDIIGIPEYLWEKTKPGMGKISVEVFEL